MPADQKTWKENLFMEIEGNYKSYKRQGTCEEVSLYIINFKLYTNT